MRDLQFAFRTLARTPLLTLVVVLSLGLGIGANTAIFSLLHQILLRSLPVERPEELVLLKSPENLKDGRSSSNNAGGQDYIYSYRMLRELEKNPAGMVGIAGFRNFGANLAFSGKTLSGSITVVSGRYFSLLGVQPALGRLIGPEDDVHGSGNPVAVLNYAYWQGRLGGADVLNKPLTVNGQLLTVVGVAPKGFAGTTLGDEPDVFLPIALKAAMTPGWDGTDKWDDYWVYTFARVQPGLGRAQAESAINVVYAALVDQQSKTIKSRDAKYLEKFRGQRLKLVDGNLGSSSERDSMKTPLYILMACTVLVLLIASANAANLLLARAAQREKEMAIRSALGAARGHLVRRMLLEALLLAFGGVVAGLLLGTWTLDLLLAGLRSGDDPSQVLTSHLSAPVLLFSVGLALVTGLLFGLYPALSATRNAVAGVLKDQSGQSSATVSAGRMRKALVCVQVVVSVLLLIPMGLFLKSFLNLTRVDLGMRTENVITFGISPDLNGYKPERALDLFERAEAGLAAIPGVRNVTAAWVPLIAGNNWGNSLAVEGYSIDPEADNNSMFNVVGAGFFSKLGIPLLRGREFTENDTQASPKVAVVNESFARHFFGDRNPLGRRFGPGLRDAVKDIEIVGVVKDSKYSDVKRKTPRVYYTPYRQNKENGSIWFYVRSALPTEHMVPQVRRVMAGLDANLPLERVRTLEDQVRSNVRSDRLVFLLVGAFAILATFLSMLGLYGVMAYSVARRTREIGIRIALGAGAPRIRSMVLKEVLLILGIGLLAGVPAALGLARLTESQLFGVKSFDPAVVCGASAALGLAALLAGFLPARRATKVDPMIALRYE